MQRDQAGEAVVRSQGAIREASKSVGWPGQKNASSLSDEHTSVRSDASAPLPDAFHVRAAHHQNSNCKFQAGVVAIVSGFRLRRKLYGCVNFRLSRG